jgi:hypothetical protein
MKKVIAILHNRMIFESSNETVVLCETFEGAVKQMTKLKMMRWADQRYHPNFEWFGYKIMYLKP